jgi:peptidyl-prolyl cis-trans isomerase D
LISHANLQQAIGRVGAVPKSVAERLYKLRSERRVADVVLVPITAIKEALKPTDDELAAYHKANAEKYRVPRLRTATALIVTPKDVDAHIKITGDQIRKAYEANKAAYSDPEKREIHQIIMQDEATAKKAMAALQKGKEFDEVARDIAKASVQSFGQLTAVQINALPFKFKDAAARRQAFERIGKLEKGRIAGPFRSDFGWHVILVVDIVPAKVKPLDDVRKDVVEDIRKAERPKILARWRDRIDDDITAGDTLEAIAKALKIKITRISGIDEKGNDAKGERVEGLPQGNQFVRRIFNQTPRETSEIYDTRSTGGFFVIRVDKETPAQVTPLKDIRARVTQDWTRDERRKRARALAEKVAASMREGRSAEGAAKQYGLTSRTTQPLVRGAADASDNGDAYIQIAVFRGKKGDVVTGRTPTGWAVAKVTKILEPDGKKAKEEQKKISDAIRLSVGAALLEAFQQTVDARYPAKIDQDSIDSLFQQQQPGS